MGHTASATLVLVEVYGLAQLELLARADSGLVGLHVVWPRDLFGHEA